MPKFLQKMKVPTRYRGTVLVTTLIVAAGLLITINYFTIQTKAAIRAYIQTESQYSKGQKDAATYLMLYIAEQHEQFYDHFIENINIPVGDRIAREALLEDKGKEVIFEGFIQGRNHPEDVEQMIWLYNNFKGVEFMRSTFGYWKEADALVEEMVVLGEQIHQDIRTTGLTSDEASDYIDQIIFLTNQLTEKETAFTDQLGSAAREITSTLVTINTIIILVIMGLSALVVNATFRALQESRRELKTINRGLVQTNQQLDSFIYASSHDLKSPLNNLEGLLKIFMIRCKVEDEEQISILDKMQSSIDKLKETIANIENLIRTDRLSKGDVSEVKFQELLDQILNENEVSLITDESEIKAKFGVEKIRYSQLALKSILYNLVSNAIKYQSPKRKLQLLITTAKVNNRICLEVADNGLGIDLEKHGQKIFSMFKRFHHHNTGSGLGLYAVKQVIEKNGGTITVESEVDRGTTFRILF